MKKINPVLLIDFYKATHAEQFPKGLTKLVSYFTPRMSRLKHEDKLILFGLQGFIKTYLIDYFNEYFFRKNEDDVVGEYERVLNATLGVNTYKSEKIRELHKLGYLPIKISALPEGTRVPIHVPMIEMSNTHTDFAWLVQALESLMSAELWHPMVSANVGYRYRQIVNEWFDKTVEDDILRKRALGDFSFRGQESLQSAEKSSAAWLLSFVNTSNVPAILYLEDNYNCDCEKEEVGFGAVSTEHSCMCSNFSVDGDERTHVKRLLEEIYPDCNFSMVSDSYDYWKMLTETLPSLKAEIMNHNGKLIVRPDSGNPADIICGTYLTGGNTPEEKGSIEVLWEQFGGTINSKGYKVLDQHIGLVYGDSITIQRAEDIYRRLETKGFAANNVSLGVGSFSMQCMEEDGQLKPFTRDTYAMAFKSVYGEINGEPIMIFKNPKTDSGFKKSQKGICHVFENEDGELVYTDGHYKGEPYNTNNPEPANMLFKVFKDGKMVRNYSIQDIRKRLHGGEF